MVGGCLLRNLNHWLESVLDHGKCDKETAELCIRMNKDRVLGGRKERHLKLEVL